MVAGSGLMGEEKTFFTCSGIAWITGGTKAGTCTGIFLFRKILDCNFGQQGRSKLVLSGDTLLLEFRKLISGGIVA
ncbi:unnamed protein product [Prunus brigantina]